MCSHQEWKTFTQRFDEGIGEGQEQEFLAEAVARIEASAEELKGRAFASEDADWACGRGRPSRTQWV